MSNPRRGEIWLVDLNPTRGSEMKKTRSVLVISSDAVGAQILREVTAALAVVVEHEIE